MRLNISCSTLPKQFSSKRRAETKMEIAQLILKKEMEQIEENKQAFAIGHVLALHLAPIMSGRSNT